MTDFTSLQLKVNDLKAKVLDRSISPVYLGSLLDDFISRMMDVDSSASGVSDTALRKASEAILKAEEAGTIAGTANAAANNAGSVAADASRKATAVIPKSIPFSRLDDMGTSGSKADMIAFARKAADGITHSYFTVLDGSHIIGTLLVLGDNMNHLLTQILETHCLISGGSIDINSHLDTAVFRYYRSYNFASHDLDAPAGAWSPWQEWIPAGAMRTPVEVDSEEELERMASEGLTVEGQLYFVSENT